jgi:hypothetical protein
MANRIKDLHISTYRMSQALADYLISVYPERVTGRTEVRGRVTGPHCPYSTTIEVAYALRESSRQYWKEGNPCISLTAIIPEPNLWDPVSPFLYRCALELWQDGQCCDQAERTVHFKQFSLGLKGLRWNGHLLTLRGEKRETNLEEDASTLRQSGYNTILTSITPETLHLWDSADRLGFLMIGRVRDKSGVGLAGGLRGRPSCLGWLVSTEFLEDEFLRIGAKLVLHADGALVGVELDKAPLKPLPKFVSFVACPEGSITSLAAHGLAALVLRNNSRAESRERSETGVSPGILGWVDQ